MAIGIVFHWSAGRYDQVFYDYHYNITYSQKTKQAKIVKTCVSDDELKAHTWQRNTGRIGIALSCCYNATSANLGSYPPREEQIELASSLAGQLIKKYNLPPEEVKSHAEWATIDGYGPGSGDPETRWDLWIPNWKGKKNLSAVLRDKALWYAGNTDKPDTIDLKTHIKELVEKYCDEFNLDMGFVLSIIEQESHFDPKAVSSSNAKGLMQLLPGTFKECLEELKLPANSDPFDTDINVHCGCYYLDWITKQLENSNKIYFLTAMAYNQGIGNVERGTVPAFGLQYANEVIARYMKS